MRKTGNSFTKASRQAIQEYSDFQQQYFINNVNTYLGYALVDELRNDHEIAKNPHKIYGFTIVNFPNNLKGSLKPHTNIQEPSGMTDVISHTCSDQEKIDKIMESDVIIYDVQDCQFDEVEYILTKLAESEYKEAKQFILISTVMTWNQTDPKETQEVKKEEVNKSQELQEFDSDIESDEVEKKSVHSQKDEYLNTFYNDEEYVFRECCSKYQLYKDLEDKVLKTVNHTSSLKTYVICSGIRYGLGEDKLFDLFKEAWCNIPEALAYYGNGNNNIPLIHILDLIKDVHSVTLQIPNKQYFLAIDGAKECTQINILQAITDQIGSGKIVQGNIDDILMREDLKCRILDVKLLPSSYFTSIEDSQLQEEYHAGFLECIEQVAKEFIQTRNLKPVKLFIDGPPASGKTYFSQKLSETLKISHVQIGDCIDEALKDKGEFGEKIRKRLNFIKAEQIEKLREELEKKKKKEDIEIDEDSIKPRIPEDLLWQIMRRRLQQNDCKYRGYILDGYPRNFADCQKVLMVKEEDGEANIEEFEYPIPKKRRGRGR